MSAKDRAVIESTKRLPELMLTSVPDGEPRWLRPPGRRNPLLVLVHGPHCAACVAYVHSLAAEASSLREWDGYPLVILPQGRDSGAYAGGFLQLADPEARVATALALRPPAAAVADQWGEVHWKESAGEEHAFPELHEVVAWLRYLAVRCPECEGGAF